MLFDFLVNNCSLVFSKKEYSNLITETIWTEEEKLCRVFVSVNTGMCFYSKIYTKVSPNKLWTITEEDPSERLYIIFSTSFMYEKIKKTCPFCNKSVKHFNMHTLLCCSTFV